MTGGPSPDDLARLLDDPNSAQMMNEAMNNPMVIQMLEQHPAIRDNPMLQQMIRNPEMRRALFSPDMMRAQLNMQRSMQGGSDGANAFPAPGTTDNTPQAENSITPNPSQPATITTTTPGNPPANPFASLFPPIPPALGGGAGADRLQAMFGNPPSGAAGQPPPDLAAFMESLQRGQFGGAPPPAIPQDIRPPEERFATELRQLNEMGFFSFERNVEALRRSGGNVEGAIEYLLTNPSS
jgi:ubiquilin